MRDKLKGLYNPINNNKEGALLSKLFRKVLIELNLVNKVDFLINRYIKHANDKDIDVLKKKTRSSLLNYVIADEMTWKTFIDLLFNLLKVKKIKLVVELTHGNGHVSTHDIVAMRDEQYSTIKQSEMKDISIDDVLKPTNDLNKGEDNDGK